MSVKKIKIVFYMFASITLSTLITGCATTSESNSEKMNNQEVNTLESESIDSIDPWENWNRKVHSLNDSLDEHVMKPTAKGYRWIMPDFADMALTNVFNNIKDINVIINDLFQGKFAQSGMDTARFIVNSTAGLGGLIDVASIIDLPRHKEDFGQTLGFWGVPTGPYLVLPFFGPSSARGTAGLIGDVAGNPLTYIGMPFVSGGAFVVDTIDKRADNLGLEKIANEAAAFGRYEFFRDSYIAQRKFLVLDGNVPEDESDFLELDESFDDFED